MAGRCSAVSGKMVGMRKMMCVSARAAWGMGPCVRIGLLPAWLAAAALVPADGTHAQTAPSTPPGAAVNPSAAPAAPAPATPSAGASTVTLGLQIEGGIQGNGDRPADGLNYGRLFDDKANTPLLNQIQLTATRPINSSATGYDVGFTLQATYGTDARYLHYLGEFNFMTDSRYQLTLLQANMLLHAPWLTAGGIDFKLGQFVTPI